MTSRQISVSTVAFDGYPIETALAQIETLGLPLVEPAFIKGYMDFSEDDFSAEAAHTMASRLKQHHLKSIAISAHMDSGLPDAPAMLARRIRYTAAIGARFTITNSTTVDRRADLEKCLAENLKLAESLGVIIALENPGNGTTNLMRDGKTGAALVQEFKSPNLKLNYDTANALTCTEGDVRPETDIENAFACSAHMHLKDVFRVDGSWRYTAIGSGELNYNIIFAKLKNRSEVPLTLELPLRLKRAFHQDPQRDAAVPDIEFVRTKIQSSWNCLAKAFGDLEVI